MLSIRVQIGSTSEDRPSEFDIPENWEDSNNQQSKNPGFYKFHQLLTSRILLRNECMTQCQDEVRILSARTQKLKVTKQCWKQLNEHNLMYIYHKQCENMQQIQ